MKKRRNNDLLVVQNANSLANHRAQIGRTVEVLVEGASKREMSKAHAQPSAGGVKQLTGRAMTDHIVVFDGNERLIGQTIRVIIDDASSFTLYGRVLTGEGTPSGFKYTTESVRNRAEADDTPSYPAPIEFVPAGETKRIGLPLA